MLISKLTKTNFSYKIGRTPPTELGKCHFDIVGRKCPGQTSPYKFVYRGHRTKVFISSQQQELVGF